MASLSALKERLQYYCYSVSPCGESDEQLTILDINRKPCGVLHKECAIRWLDNTEAWRERFPAGPVYHHTSTLRLALEILSSHALNQASVIRTLADTDFYSPSDLRQIRLSLSSVLYGFGFRLAEVRVACDYHEVQSGLYTLTESLFRLADAVFSAHIQQWQPERAWLDNLAQSLTLQIFTLDEMLLQPGCFQGDESATDELSAVSAAMTSLLLDVALVRGGCWRQ
jgi:hypothetical protein